MKKKRKNSSKGKKMEKYNLGGMLGGLSSVLGPLSMAVPQLAPLAGIASAGAAMAPLFEKPELQYTAGNTTSNPMGFALGGDLNSVSDNTIEVRGNNKNKIDDVFVGNKAFTHGETITDDYVFSTLIRNPFTGNSLAEDNKILAKSDAKAQKKGKFDKEAQRTLQINKLFRNKLKTVNETLKGAIMNRLAGGMQEEQQKFQFGGPLNGDPTSTTDTTGLTYTPELGDYVTNRNPLGTVKKVEVTPAKYDFNTEFEQISPSHYSDVRIYPFNKEGATINTYEDRNRFNKDNYYFNNHSYYVDPPVYSTGKRTIYAKFRGRVDKVQVEPSKIRTTYSPVVGPTTPGYFNTNTDNNTNTNTNTGTNTDTNPITWDPHQPWDNPTIPPDVEPTVTPTPKPNTRTNNTPKEYRIPIERNVRASTPEMANMTRNQLSRLLNTAGRSGLNNVAGTTTVNNPDTLPIPELKTIDRNSPYTYKNDIGYAKEVDQGFEKLMKMLGGSPEQESKPDPVKKSGFDYGSSLQYAELLGKTAMLAGGYEKQKARVINTPISLQAYDPNPLIQQNQRTYNALKQGINNSVGLANKQANLQQAASNKYNSDANILSRFQNMNKQEKVRYEQRLAQRQGVNNQSRLQTDIINSQNRAALFNAVNNIFTSVGNLGRAREAQKENRSALNMMLQAFPDIAPYMNIDGSNATGINATGSNTTGSTGLINFKDLFGVGYTGGGTKSTGYLVPVGKKKGG